MPAITKPSNHFNAVLYSGANPSSQTVGVGFQPDFVWIKSRTQTYGHYVFDVVRTPTFGLITNTTAGDSTGDALTFTANGFTTTASAGATNDPTGAPNNFACFSWKAGGAAVTNNDGTITSQVSANPTAGFSVVTYSANGSTGTVGHGLGVAPSMIIVKKRNAVERWCVFHTSTSNAYLYLNETNAAETGNANLRFGNNSSVVQPSSTVFTIGSANDVNGTSGTYVAYCFAAVAGYSAFGSYTGNGSADGPFVYTGFRPRFVMVKSSVGTNTETNWVIWDSTRTSYNGLGAQIFPNRGYIEGQRDDDGGALAEPIDFLSNGFKIRSSFFSNNGSSSYTYIYAAFAEAPFKFASAR